MEWLENGWIILAIVAAALAFLAWLLGLVWERFVTLLVGKTETDLDDRLAKAALRPLQAAIFSSGTLQVVRALHGKPEIGGSIATPYLQGLLMIGSVLAFTWLASRLLEEVAGWYLEGVGRKAGARLDQQIMPLLRRVLRLALVFVAATIILGFYDVKLTALLGAAGVASLAVALAAQETVANMIGGLTIMIDRPFRVGDRIELSDGKIGDVVEIGMRSTKIMTFDRTIRIIPNSELVKQTLTNLNYPDSKVFVRQAMGIAYGSDVEKAKRVLKEAASRHPKVLSDPPPQVFFTDFGESSLDLVLVYAVAHYEDTFGAKDGVNTEINRRFEEEGIEIPFPQRVVHLKRE
jgi:small-conductance mechanosensitive channel